MLAPGATGTRVCYAISNFSAPNYFNITLNGTKFTIRLNFIGPSSAGITIDDNNSYTLQINQSQVVAQSPNYVYTSWLIGVSWLPVQHTASMAFCSTPNNQTSPNTITSLPTSTSSSIPTSTTTSTSTTLRRTTITTSMATTTIMLRQPFMETGEDKLLEMAAEVGVLAVLIGGLLLHIKRRRDGQKKGPKA